MGVMCKVALTMLTRVWVYLIAVRYRKGSLRCVNWFSNTKQELKVELRCNVLCCDRAGEECGELCLRGGLNLNKGKGLLLARGRWLLLVSFPKAA
jgi:hypothetical protein